MLVTADIHLRAGIVNVYFMSIITKACDSGVAIMIVYFLIKASNLVHMKGIMY